MHRRIILAAILIAFVLGPVAPAWAQGNGVGNSNSQGNGNTNGQNADEGKRSENEPGNNHANGNSGSSANASITSKGSGAELSQDEVLAAVGAGNAVSLEDILPDVRSRTGGEVIDAKLVRTRGLLVYAVTVLTPAGKVTTEYYYSRSGVHVEGQGISRNH
jgi:uncharacterized membrane protein YkoI